MSWFQETLLGHMVTPRHKKVRTYLKEGFQYEISSTLEHPIRRVKVKEAPLSYSS